MTDNLSAFKEHLISRDYDFKENEPLKNHTTFKIGGNCSFLVCPRTQEQLIDILRCCREWNIKKYVIGKGSNILATDEGFDGVIVKLTDSFSEITVKDTVIYCQAGASLAKVCYEAYLHGLSGLEFAWGIPGTIGGALYMNAGAYGGEMKDVVISSTHITDHLEEGCFQSEQLDLCYRHSIYTDMPDYCITGIKLQLIPGLHSEIKAKMDDLMERRKNKQPLEYPSAGSTFKRPEGNYASALIDQCGLKGMSVGGAQVSEKHCGFVINKNNATCGDVLNLIKQIQEKVFTQTGYRLECEIKML